MCCKVQADRMKITDIENVLQEHFVRRKITDITNEMEKYVFRPNKVIQRKSPRPVRTDAHLRLLRVSGATGVPAVFVTRLHPDDSL